jgi:hypothetical protein
MIIIVTAFIAFSFISISMLLSFMTVGMAILWLIGGLHTGPACAHASQADIQPRLDSLHGSATGVLR